jgi:hypothetical protein
MTVGGMPYKSKLLMTSSLFGKPAGWPSYEALIKKVTELESALAKAQHLEKKLRHSARRLHEIIGDITDIKQTHEEVK